MTGHHVRVAVPRRLYKFMPCDKPERVSFVRDLLTHRRLKYTAVTKFNDPFEARPHLKMPGGTADEQRAALLQHIEEVQRTAGVPTPPALRAYVESGQLEEARELLQEAIRTVLSLVPVACLAGTRSSILMWSLYADSHKGACVHLSGRIEPLRTAWPINYCDDYPVLGLSWPGMESTAFTDVCILTKATHWRHEQEYRLVSPVGGQVSEVNFVGEIGTLPTGSVTGITLGALMSREIAAELTEVAAAHGLPVWRAGRSDNAYRLRFPRNRH
jgi:hypothetical protein